MADYISRALIADALAEWREHLRSAATVSPLRDLAASDASVIEINSAHPSGLAQLFAHRTTLLSTMIQEPGAYRVASHRGRHILETAERVMAESGAWTAALVVGTACWEGHEVPLLLRGLSLDRAREDDLAITLRHDVWLNPVFLDLARERGDQSPLAELAARSIEGPQFDPRPTWNAVRDIGHLFGPDFEVRERLLIGAFDDPEQRLLDDVDALDTLIGASDVIAAAAGDTDARTILAEPLTRPGSGDRDPFGERGIGDLDDVAFAALDAIATGRSLVVSASPGSDPIGFAAAVAADFAASGKTIAVVTGGDRVSAAVGQRLDALGAGDLYVTGASEAWNADARARLLASLTLDPPTVDEEAIRALGLQLVESRHELQQRLAALHRTHRPWGVSAFEAVQAIVRLTSGEIQPVTTVRLGRDAGAAVAERGLAGTAAAIVRRVHGEETAPPTTAFSPATAALEAAAMRPPRPWWEGLVDPEKGAHLDEALAVLVRDVHAMRAESAAAANETGLDAADSLAAWAEQVTLFTDVRETLDVFSPAIFHRSLTDLVAATAPPGSPKAADYSRRERRALVRRAGEMLRPGREGEPLHERLLAAQEQSARWRAHCSAGGWPMVPDAFDAYAARLARVQAAWSVFTEPIEPAEAEELALLPWDELIADLERRAEGIPGGIDHAPARPATVDLDLPGFSQLLASIDERKPSPEQIRADVEFAWWSSAFDAIVEASPELTQYGAIGLALETYLAYDAAFADARIGPLMRAAAERRRTAIATYADHARDLFAELMEGAGGSIRDLWLNHGPVASALRPVVIASAEQVPRMLPPSRCLDAVLIVGAESLAFAELVPAIARAGQVVLVADVASATRSAVTTLAALLPALSLHALPQPRDPRVTRVLSELAYGRALLPVPAPGEDVPDRLEVISIDAVSSPAAGSDVVESSRAEVKAVAEHVVRLASAVPRRSIAVVAGNDLHAARIEDAIAERSRRIANDTPVVTLGSAGGLDVDHVVVAVGYAPDTRGSLPASLGILSSHGGSAALAQAVAAARESVTVVTALEPHELTALAASADPGHGVGGLRELVLAQERPAVAPERPRPGPSDWLLADVARRLRAEGYAVRLRYGFGVDAIPMVVGDKHARGYTVAVITDENTSSGPATLRDRVRWQYMHLEALGWRVVALWTIDVFMDPEAAAADIRRAVAGETHEEVEAEQAEAQAQAAAEVSASQAADAGVAEPDIAPPPFLFSDVVTFEGEWLPGPEPDEGPEPAPEEPDLPPEAWVAPQPESDVIVEAAVPEPAPVEPATPAAEPEPITAPEVDIVPVVEAAATAQPAQARETAPEPEAGAPEPSEPAREPRPEASERGTTPGRPAMPSIGPITRKNPIQGPPIKPAERPLIPTRAWEDEDQAWGGSGSQPSRDEELKREKPPHW